MAQLAVAAEETMTSARQSTELTAEGAEGNVPRPLLSSLSRQWRGIVVEHYRARDVEMERRTSKHVVTVFLRGPVDVAQRRYGRSFQRTMHTGEIIVAPAGEPKQLQHKEEAEVLKLWLDPGLVARIADQAFAHTSEPIALLDNYGARDFDVETIARRLLHEMQSDALGQPLYAETLAIELVIHLLRHYSTANAATAVPPTTLTQSKVQRITDYINDKLADDLDLERLAAILHMSPWHFAHAFKQATGLAPHRFVLLRRIERAKSLLRETDLAISEVAHCVGYSHQSNFSIAFRQFTGRPPSAFRRSGRLPE